MLRTVSFLTLLLFALMMSPPTAQAQFWKKKTKKEQKAKRPERSKEVVEGNKKEPPKKRIEPEYPDTERKETYRIDVLLPLFLNHLVADGKPIQKRLPAKMQPVINFYEGLKLAADTLNSLNYHLDIYIHDIESPEGSIHSLIKNDILSQSDLIIGYLQSAELPEITSFAKKKKINFLSALSPADSGISDNPYFILIQPNLATHLSRLVNFACKRNFRNPKFVFYLENSLVQKEAYQLLQQELEEEDYLSIDCSKPAFNRDSLRTIFDPHRTNVLFINIFSNALADSLLQELAALSSEFAFEIYGMPSWKTLPGLNSKKPYSEMAIYYTNPFYYDIQSAPGKAIAEKYKEEHGGIPSELVYRGYETLVWAADLLFKYGTIFNRQINDVRAVPFTRYSIQPQWSEKNDFLYLGNEHLYIFQYKDGYFSVER